MNTVKLQHTLKSSQPVCVFTRLLVTASKGGRSPTSGFPNCSRASATSFSQQQFTTTEHQQSSDRLTHQPSHSIPLFLIVLLTTSRHGPHRRQRSLLLLNCFSGPRRKHHSSFVYKSPISRSPTSHASTCHYTRKCYWNIYRSQADWTFILESGLPAKVLCHLPRKCGLTAPRTEKSDKPAQWTPYRITHRAGLILLCEYLLRRLHTTQVVSQKLKRDPWKAPLAPWTSPSWRVTYERKLPLNKNSRREDCNPSDVRTTIGWTTTLSLWLIN
jgi:hypothetical protein